MNLGEVAKEEVKQKPVKNDEIVFICCGCRETVKKGDQISLIYPLVLTLSGVQPTAVMICEKCGVVSALPDEMAKFYVAQFLNANKSKIEQPKIITPS